jgi:hypothetical protein
MFLDAWAKRIHPNLLFIFYEDMKKAEKSKTYFYIVIVNFQIGKIIFTSESEWKLLGYRSVVVKNSVEKVVRLLNHVRDVQTQTNSYQFSEIQ